MKKILSAIIAITLTFSFSVAYALNVKDAYNEFKSIHPDFVNSLVNEGITEKTIISFIGDVYDYLIEIDKSTPVTKNNFEKNAMTAVVDVSSREKYYQLQDTLLILYPDAIKLAVTQEKVAPEFEPLVATVKRIYFADSSSGSGGDGGGSSGGSSGGGSSEDSDVSDTKDETPDKTEEVTPPQSTEKFTDIDSSHWAYTSVSYLADSFILNGYLDGSFKPENNITRAEFAKIIVSATGSFDSSAVASFKDVSVNEWYYPYVAAAYKLGYITGYPDGTFHPEDNITRADICTIVNRVLKATSGSDYSKFTDDSLIPDYAKNAVYSLSAKGIVNGYPDGTFAPKAFATRAQTAKIIYSAFFQK